MRPAVVGVMMVAALLALVACGVDAAASDWQQKGKIVGADVAGVNYFAVAKTKTNKFTGLPKALILKVSEIPDAATTHNEAGKAEIEAHKALSIACGKYVVQQVDAWIVGGTRLYQVLERMDSSAAQRIARKRPAVPKDRPRWIDPPDPVRYTNARYSPFYEPAFGLASTPTVGPLNGYLNVLAQMIGAVNCMHKAGYVHRRIWMNSWAVSYDRKTVKLADFGDALSRKQVDEMTRSSASTYTQRAAASAQFEYQPPGSLQPSAPNPAKGDPPPPLPFGVSDFTFERRVAFDTWATAWSAIGMWNGVEPYDLLVTDGALETDNRAATTFAETHRWRLNPTNFATQLENWHHRAHSGDFVHPDYWNLIDFRALTMPPALATLLTELVFGTRSLQSVSTTAAPWPATWKVSAVKAKPKKAGKDANSKDVYTTTTTYTYVAPAGSVAQPKPQPQSLIGANAVSTRPQSPNTWWKPKPTLSPPRK